MTVEMVAMIILNVAASGTTALIITPLLAGFGWWQMGVLSERNDWLEGRHSQPAPPKPVTEDK